MPFPSRVSLAIAMLLSAGTAALADPLAAYRWKSRLLLLFAPDAGDARLVRQEAMLREARTGLSERDQVVLRIAGGRVDALVGAAPEGAQALADELRARFGVGREEFAVVLVGKDGGAKRREGAPVAPEALFATIDAMPMRRREMRADDGAGDGAGDGR